MLMTPQFEVAIVGGGPAGGAAAIRLARAGVEVVLIERTATAHHKVCGEYLSAAAIAELEDLGIDVFALGALDIATAAVTKDDRVAEATLPSSGAALSRQVLDQHVLDCAAAAGATVMRGIHVKEYCHLADYTLTTSAGKIVAKHLFIATGKHDLRAARRVPAPKSPIVGFKLHLALNTSHLEGNVMLAPFGAGYAGLMPIGPDVANLCCVARPDRIDGGKEELWNRTFRQIRRENPEFTDLTYGAEPHWDKPLAVGHIPYGFLRSDTEGAWWLGDQAAVVPSFTGSGIGIALRSARYASDKWLMRQTAQSYQEGLANYLRPLVRRSMMISRVASSSRPSRVLMRALVSRSNLFGVLLHMSSLSSVL